MYNKLAALEKLGKHLQLFTPEAETVHPEKEYVYLDEAALTKDDLFEDEPEVAEPDPYDNVFLDEEGHTLFADGLPYGPMADVFRFDITDDEHVSLAKLKCYEHIQRTADPDSAYSIRRIDIRMQLSDWLSKELLKDGAGVYGDDDESIRDKFSILRSFKKIGMGTTGVMDA